MTTREPTEQEVEAVAMAIGKAMGWTDGQTRANGPIVARAAIAAMPSGWRPDSPDDLRSIGWAVGCHNDYRLNGEDYTFWLLTMEDQCVKGEGRTDADALNSIREQLGRLPSPPESTP